MSDTVMSLLAGLLSGLGFVLVALSQERHWCAVTETTVTERMLPRGLQWVGFLAQPAALGLSLQAQGPGFGSLLWAVTISAAAMAVAFALAWRPQSLRPVARLLRTPTGRRAKRIR